jgi:hypothetical protein
MDDQEEGQKRPAHRNIAATPTKHKLLAVATRSCIGFRRHQLQKSLDNFQDDFLTTS